MKSDCFIILIEPAVTSESNYFGNGCRLLGRKPLWVFYTLSTPRTTFSVWLFLGYFALLKTNFPWYFIYSKLWHFNLFFTSWAIISILPEGIFFHIFLEENLLSDFLITGESLTSRISCQKFCPYFFTWTKCKFWQNCSYYFCTELSKYPKRYQDISALA